MKFHNNATCSHSSAYQANTPNINISKYCNNKAGIFYMSQVIVLQIQKVSRTFTKANLRPKNFSLGLIMPKVIFYECLGYFLC